MRNGAGEIARQDRSFGCTHQRRSISQRATHANQTSAITARAVMKTSTISRSADVGRCTRDAKGHSATMPAKRSSGAGRVQVNRWVSKARGSRSQRLPAQPLASGSPVERVR
jgi:hypothetical protein